MIRNLVALALAAHAVAARADAQFKYDAVGNLVGVYDVSDDPTNCGSVGYACGAPLGATACCSRGTCGVVAGGGVCTQSVSVQVAVTPSSSTVPAGETLQFSASVSNTANPAVMWQVNGVLGGNSTVGTIDWSGVYEAPAIVPSPSTVIVSAVSEADPTKTASAGVTILSPVAVSVSPSSVSVRAGTTQQFVAAVSGATDTSVTWTVNGLPGGDATVGTVDSTGLYRAPVAAPTPAQVTVGASSNADSSQAAYAAVTIQAGVLTVQVSPATVMVPINGSQQFAAAVQNGSTSAVTWKVNGVTGGNSTVGTISTSGLYKAPASVPNPATVSVTAVSTADGVTTGTASLAVTSPISVALSPPSLLINPGKTQQFTATVGGTTNTAVSWKVNGVVGGNSTIGTMTTAGLYTAPATVPSPATVTVAAVSAADGVTSASAPVTITATTGVLVSVSPASASVGVGLTQQYTATVQNNSNTSVTWKVNGVTGGNSTAGTISTSGLYKAPASVPSPATVTITAVSKADTTKSGAASAIIIASVTVSLSPTTATVTAGQTKQFTATVKNSADTTVLWAVNGVAGGDPIVGTISASGLYTAPAVVPTPAGVTVTATAHADTSKSASATVTVGATAVAVSVSPSSLTAQCGAVFAFTALVVNTSNHAVTWKVNNVTGGNATLGTISAAGVYSAPATVPTPATVNITAVSSADTTRSATAHVAITPAPPVVVEIDPAYTVLPLGGTQQFSATALHAADPSVSWTVNGVAGGDDTVGTIDPTGLYVAPSVLPTAPVYVSAVSNASPDVSATAVVTINNGAPVSVSVLPDRWYMIAGETFYPTATVTNTSDTRVTWFVNGVMGGTDATGTVVNDPILGTTTGYTAPTVVSGTLTVTVTAVADADPTQQASTTVTITNPPPWTVIISPPEATVVAGQQFQFTGRLITPPWIGSTTPTWFVNGIEGGTPEYGTITSSGLYTAPFVPPPEQVRVTAQVGSDTTSAATALVTVLPGDPVTILPGSATVQTGDSYRFKAVVLNPVDPSVTWQVNGVMNGDSTVGTIDSTGLYTAPSVVPNPANVTIAAISNAEPTASATANVTITSDPVVRVQIVGGPGPMWLEVGATKLFSAYVYNTSNTSVTWLVNGIGGGNASIGTITRQGLYRAPATRPVPASIVVTAVSVADPTRSDSVVVTLVAKLPTAVAFNVLCFPITVPRGTTYQFQAVGNDLSNVTGDVSWMVDGLSLGDTQHGNIDRAGLYRAPNAPPSYPYIPIMVLSKTDPSVWNVIPIYIQ